MLRVAHSRSRGVTPDPCTSIEVCERRPNGVVGGTALVEWYELARLNVVPERRPRVAARPSDLDRVRDAIALFGDVWIGSVRHAMPLLAADDVTYLVDLAEDLSDAAADRDASAFGFALRAIAAGFARIEGNVMRVAVIDILGPQIGRIARHARGARDWDESRSCADAIGDAVRERDAALTRAAIVTLVDDVLPRIIDHAE